MSRYNDMPFSIVRMVLDLFETFLVIRLILIFFGANRDSGIVRFFYGMTGPFVSPFQNIFSPTVVDGWTLDWATVLAIIAYAFLAAVIMRLLSILSAPAKSNDSSSL